MKDYIVMADIAGNSAALSAVLKDMAARYNDGHVIALGNVFGFGYDPCGCYDLLNKNCIEIVSGGNDRYIIDHNQCDELQAQFARSVDTARSELNPIGGCERLRSARDCIGGELVDIHYSMSTEGGQGASLEEWNSVGRFAAWSGAPGRTLVISGGHVPWHGIIGQVGVLAKGSTQFILPDAGCVIGAGSVGMPKDRDPRACYCYISEPQRMVEWRRVEYDAQSVVRAAKIARPFMHQSYWQRLLIGV
jgi:hypothetical protein